MDMVPGAKLGRMFVRLVCGRSRVRSSRPATSCVEIGHEITSTAILSLPLNQEGQLSVTGKRMCNKYWETTLQSEQCG